MYPGSLPYTILLLIIAILTGGISHYAFTRSNESYAASFGWLMIAITQWVAVDAIETMSPTIGGKIVAEQLSYWGATATPIFWLFFALEYNGYGGWLTPWKKLFFTAWPLAATGLALTNAFHHLLWSTYGLDPAGLPGLIIEDYGPTFWMIIVISYSSVLAGIIIWLISYLKSTRIFRKQINIMVAGALIPLISHAIFLAGNGHGVGFDWTPFSFALSGILLSIGIFRYDLLYLVPLAAPLVIENLSDSVMVVDNHDRIVSLNPAAHKWLKLGEAAIGQDAHHVLKGLELIWDHWNLPEQQVQIEMGQGDYRRWFQMMISAVKDQKGNIKGKVIVARDRTREETGLMTERRNSNQMELVNSITRAALESSDLHEMIQILAVQIGRVLEAGAVLITLWDKSNHMALLAASYGLPGVDFANTIISPGEQTLTGAVLEGGRILVIEDLPASQFKDHSFANNHRIKSILAIPLVANNEKLGAVLITFKEIHHFSSVEIDICERMGSQIALAIYKARLLDDSFHRIAQLAVLDDVSKSVADSLDEQEILQRTVEALINRFGYAEAAISLLVNENEMEIAAITGTEDLGFELKYRQKVGDGIIGHTAQTRQAYFTGAVENDPYYFTIGERSGSAAGVPMLDEGQLLGVLYVESIQRAAFKQDDIQTLTTLTSHVVTAVQKARLYRQAQDHLRAITTLQSISQTVTSSLDLQNIFQTVIQLLKDTFDYTYLSIYLLEENILRLGAQLGYPQDLIFYEIPITTGVVGRTILTRQTQFVPNVSQDKDFLRASYEVESEICAPLLKGNSVLGVINIEAAPGRPLTPNDVDLLNALAGSVAIAIDNARLHAEVRSLALTDGLTQLHNRRSFDMILETEIARAERYTSPLTLVFLDLDNFKVYNDRWGHPAGDERLKEIACLLKQNARHPDVAARYGGEEFALILPNTSITGALILAERIRVAAENQAVNMLKVDGYIPGYTISLGVATYPDNGRYAIDLLLAADHASMSAKRQGKNRICVASAPDEIVTQ